MSNAEKTILSVAAVIVCHFCEALQECLEFGVQISDVGHDRR